MNSTMLDFLALFSIALLALTSLGALGAAALIISEAVKDRARDRKARRILDRI